MKKTILALGIGVFSSAVWAQSEMMALSDEQLSQVEGQALLNMQVTSPKQANPDMQSANIGFYRLSTNAEMELNMNVRKLQLGCGGINGAGACDLDIDNLSLSGISDTADGRASSSAKITNPFIEFAVKNPYSSATREVVGFRLSAEQIKGLLTAGTENSSSPNGINSFSGFMKIQSGIGNTAAERSKLKGYASTQETFMDLGKYPIHGRMTALGTTQVDFVTTGGGFYIPGMQNLPFETDSLVINGNRRTNAQLTATVNIPTIHLGSGRDYPQGGRVTFDPNDPYQTTTGVYTAGHPVNAEVTGCKSITGLTCLIAPNGRKFNGIQMTGKIEGAQAQVNFQEALGFIHKIELNSPFSLSLQKEKVRWPGAEEANVAQPGWWLAITDPISIGEIMPEDRLSIEPLLGQFAEQAGDFLQKNPAKTNDLRGILTGNNLEANIGTIRPSQMLNMNLSNLQLKGQNFAPNCFGGHKFC